MLYLQIVPTLTKLLQSDRMWNDITTLVRAVYPGLLLLRLSDKKTPGMDKLYFYVRQMDETMARSKELLDDMEKKYRGTNNTFSNSKMLQYFLNTSEITDYCNEFGNKGDDDDDDDDDSVTEDQNINIQYGDDSDDENDEKLEPEDEETLGDRMKARWNHRKKKLIHDLSITGWMLSPVPEIMIDVAKSHNGDHRNAVERLLKRWVLYNVSSLISYLYVIFIFILLDLTDCNSVKKT